MRSILAARRRHARRTALVMAALVVVCLCALVQQGEALVAGRLEACPPVGRAHSAGLSSAALARQAAGTGILVCVGARSITGATFDHWAGVAQKSEGPTPTHPPTARELIKEVMGFLISSDWVLDATGAAHRCFCARSAQHVQPDPQATVSQERRISGISQTIWRDRRGPDAAREAELVVGRNPEARCCRPSRPGRQGTCAETVCQEIQTQVARTDLLRTQVRGGRLRARAGPAAVGASKPRRPV